MLVVTTESLPGYAIVKVLGHVDGSAICVTRSSSLSGKGMLWGKRLQFDAEEIAESHQNTLPEAIDSAIEEMIKQAREAGADAVIGMQTIPIQGSQLHLYDRTPRMRFTESVITMYVCGTAVCIQKLVRVIGVGP